MQGGTVTWSVSWSHSSYIVAMSHLMKLLSPHKTLHLNLIRCFLMAQSHLLRLMTSLLKNRLTNLVAALVAAAAGTKVALVAASPATLRSPIHEPEIDASSTTFQLRCKKNPGNKRKHSCHHRHREQKCMATICPTLWAQVV